MLESSGTVTHAVIPAAGRGTRFLPLTKVVPKELLPLGNRPCIDYVVSEAIDAGIDDILFITRSGKEAILEYFAEDPDLSAAVEGTHYAHAVDDVLKIRTSATISGVDQGDPKGLGHAIAQAAQHVGNNPFVVLLPDDLVPSENPLLQQMVAVREAFGGSVIAAIRVTPEEATSYGSIAYDLADSPEGSGISPGGVVKVTHLVEKPSVDHVLSDCAVAGRYLLDPAVFGVLENLEPGRGGEIQVTDALDILARMDPADGGGLHAVIYEGLRYDTGTPAGYLEAYLRAALTDKQRGHQTRWLIEEVLREFGS